ncbi:CRISPR-associated DxTHG motif protein [Vibrio alginolyticus]|nr:CRISPR-associated DxTHG motif protein [Vibrio parahaemolyticus]
MDSHGFNSLQVIFLT